MLTGAPGLFLALHPRLQGPRPRAADRLRHRVPLRRGRRRDARRHGGGGRRHRDFALSPVELARGKPGVRRPAHLPAVPAAPAARRAQHAYDQLRIARPPPPATTMTTAPARPDTAPQSVASATPVSVRAELGGIRIITYKKDTTR